MLIHYVLISYKWNFLAETAMRSLPSYVKPFLIHTGKSDERVKTFSKDRELFDECDMGNLYHGPLIDRLFQSSQFKHVIECDALIMIDHDCWFAPGVFQSIEAKLIGQLQKGSCIVGTDSQWEIGHFPPRHFFTTIPMFAIKPSTHWPAYWWHHYTDEQWYYDTGQWLAHFIPDLVGNVVLGKNCRHYYHWGSQWQFMEYRKPIKPRVFEKWSKHYDHLMSLDLWHPCAYELKEMDSYQLLQMAVQSYRKRMLRQNETLDVETTNLQ